MALAQHMAVLALHLVARLRSDRVDLRHPEIAPVAWDTLRRRFPDALLGKLMPDHPHLIIPYADPEMARRSLSNVCGRIQYRLGWPRGSWEPVPEPRIITKRQELRRHFRYGALNECRARLARDPLEALWSTYREVFGAVIDPWIDARAVLEYLGAPPRGALAWLHAFVSGDPSVAVEGTPCPRSMPAGLISTTPLADVVRAAAAALRTEPEAVRRRGRLRGVFVGLARAVGWWRPALLAEVCAVDTCSIRRLGRTADPHAVAHALTCLGDSRLLLRTPSVASLSLEKRAKEPR